MHSHFSPLHSLRSDRLLAKAVLLTLLVVVADHAPSFHAAPRPWSAQAGSEPLPFSQLSAKAATDGSPLRSGSQKVRASFRTQAASRLDHRRRGFAAALGQGARGCGRDRAAAASDEVRRRGSASRGSIWV